MLGKTRVDTQGVEVIQSKYEVTVSEVFEDGEHLFCATVSEFPDLFIYEKSRELAVESGTTHEHLLP